jgi:excisionase family DNA binding protein
LEPGGAQMRVRSLGPKRKGDDDMTQLFNQREAAEILSLSEQTVRRLTREGRLPAVRIGASVRYRDADLEAFIETHAVAATHATDTP